MRIKFRCKIVGQLNSEGFNALVEEAKGGIRGEDKENSVDNEEWAVAQECSYYIVGGHRLYHLAAFLSSGGNEIPGARSSARVVFFFYPFHIQQRSFAMWLSLSVYIYCRDSSPSQYYHPLKRPSTNIMFPPTQQSALWCNNKQKAKCRAIRTEISLVISWIHVEIYVELNILYEIWSEYQPQGIIII